jgi:hypothetical protein
MPSPDGGHGAGGPRRGTPRTPAGRQRCVRSLGSGTALWRAFPQRRHRADVQATTAKPALARKYRHHRQRDAGVPADDLRTDATICSPPPRPSRTSPIPCGIGQSGTSPARIQIAPGHFLVTVASLSARGASGVVLAGMITVLPAGLAKPLLSAPCCAGLATWSSDDDRVGAAIGIGHLAVGFPGVLPALAIEQVLVAVAAGLNVGGEE